MNLDGKLVGKFLFGKLAVKNLLQFALHEVNHH